MESLMSDTAHLVHQLRVTVKPSVNYQTGQVPNGKMAKRIELIQRMPNSAKTQCVLM